MIRRQSSVDMSMNCASTQAPAFDTITSSLGSTASAWATASVQLSMSAMSRQILCGTAPWASMEGAVASRRSWL